MKLSIAKGSTSVLVRIFIQDSSSTTGEGLSGLAYNTSSLVCYRGRDDDGNAGGTAITLATATRGTWTSGGFVEKDATNMPGWYEFGIPDNALASGSRSVSIHFQGAADMAPCPLEIELTGWNNQDAVRGGMTALPNANAAAANGLITIGSGSGQLNVASGKAPATIAAGDIATDALTAAAVKADAAEKIAEAVRDVDNTAPATDSLGEAINSAASAGDPWGTSLPGAYSPGEAGYILGTNLDAAVSTRSTFAGGAVASVTGDVGGNVTGSVASVVGNVGGNVAGSVGSVTGNVGGNVVGTVASVVGNVGGNVTGTVASVVGNVGGDVTGNVGGNVTGTIGSLAAQAKADVNAEVDTALADINLDHLVKLAVDTSLANTVHDNSVMGYILAKSAVSNYARTTDSLEAQGDAIQKLRFALIPCFTTTAGTTLRFIGLVFRDGEWVDVHALDNTSTCEITATEYGSAASFTTAATAVTSRGWFEVSQASPNLTADRHYVYNAEVVISGVTYQFADCLCNLG